MTELKIMDYAELKQSACFSFSVSVLLVLIFTLDVFYISYPLMRVLPHESYLKMKMKSGCASIIQGEYFRGGGLETH